MPLAQGALASTTEIIETCLHKRPSVVHCNCMFSVLVGYEVNAYVLFIANVSLFVYLDQIMICNDFL